ncbi:hypothetical protein AYI68_g7697 [Smittium mucronatum]|uniref:Reverse transcriptase domain-containing protein n=1 Tax=Smittium mucronatum TaxID=133383 RepID=A0A1R0GN06_9FUNG|nr:hypothetical protein AYI68_g7697 [Smittium mucronatum]
MINGLYINPKIFFGIFDEFSSPSNYLCGDHQGYPISPILSDFYINDIFKDFIEVEVPGLDRKIPGLLFDEDAVLLVDSKKLKKSLDAITIWSET